MFQKKLICLFMVIGLLISIRGLKGQENSFQYKQIAVAKILPAIEAHFDIKINYDPIAMKELYFSGSLTLDNPRIALETLFASLPYQAQKIGEFFVIGEQKPGSITICGQLLANNDSSPLAFASIFSRELKKGVQADQNGEFSFSLIAYPYQEISISYLGYKERKIQLKNWEKSCQTIYLIEENVTINEVIIQEYILPGISSGEAYHSVNMDIRKLFADHSSQEHDILKTVQMLPGISSIDETTTNLQIRGSTPDQNLILWENATLYDPGHFFGMLSSVNPFVIDHVEVYKGVFHPKYENRVGGIVDLSLSDQPVNEVKAGLGISFTELHSYLELPIWKEKLSVILSGRNSIGNIFSSPTLENYAEKVFQFSRVDEQRSNALEEEDPFNENSSFYDYNAKIQFNPTDRLQMKASVFQASNSYDISSDFFDDELVEESMEYASQAYNAEINWKWRPQHQSILFVTSSYYENNHTLSLSDNQDVSQQTLASAFNEISSTNLGLQHNYQIDKMLQLELGYEFELKDVSRNLNYTSFFEEGFGDTTIAEGNFHNVFASFDYQLSKKIRIDAGLRGTYYQEADQQFYSPRASVQYAPLPSVKLFASWGNLFQFISKTQTYDLNDLGTFANIWTLTDAEDESYISANKLALGISIDTKGWLIDLEAYKNKTEGLPSFSNSREETFEVDSNGSTEAIGIDLLVKKNWEHYLFWLNYSLSKNTFQFSEGFTSPFPAENDQRHRLSLVNTLNFKPFQVHLTYQYKTGLPITSSPRIVSYVDEEDDENYFELVYDRFNDSRLPDYHRLDIELSYKSQFFMPKLKTEFSISLLNILDRENPFSRNYFIDDDEDELEEVEIASFQKRLLGRTPLLMLRFYWE